MNIPTDLVAYLLSVLDQVYVLLILILLVVILGIGAAIKTKTFKWSRVADFLSKDFLLNVVGWLVANFTVVYMLPAVVPGLSGFVDSVAPEILYGALVAALIGRAVGHARTLGLSPAFLDEIFNKMGLPAAVHDEP